MPAHLELARELDDPALKEQRLARLSELEDQVFLTAAGVINAFIAFHEVDPEQAIPPEDWVREYGEEAALKRLAVAKMGWLPKNQAPAGVDLATRVYVGTIKARSYRAGTTNNQLNVKIELPAPTSREHPGAETYEVIDIE